MPFSPLSSHFRTVVIDATPLAESSDTILAFRQRVRDVQCKPRGFSGQTDTAGKGLVGTAVAIGVAGALVAVIAPPVGGLIIAAGVAVAGVGTATRHGRDAPRPADLRRHALSDLHIMSPQASSELVQTLRGKGFVQGARFRKVVHVPRDARLRAMAPQLSPAQRRKIILVLAEVRRLGLIEQRQNIRLQEMRPQLSAEERRSNIHRNASGPAYGDRPRGSQAHGPNAENLADIQAQLDEVEEILAPVEPAIAMAAIEPSAPPYCQATDDNWSEPVKAEPVVDGTPTRTWA